MFGFPEVETRSARRFTLFPPRLGGGVLVGHAVVAGGDQSGGADEMVALVFAQGPLGHGGEGQVVVLQDGQAVLRFLLLHVEHLPQLLELLQLAEGLQHHQHDDQAQDQVH